MNFSNLSIKKLLAASSLALCCAVSADAARQAQAAPMPQPPAWQKTAVIYCVNPEIFSSHGLAGITAQLPRLQALGVNVLWLMPFQPLGHNVTVSGAAKTTLIPPTPYCQDDLKGIDPAEGSAADLTQLMTSAHAAGMHVILDVAINQTAWSSPLVTAHPEYYYHSDNNPTNLSSIEVGFPNGAKDGDIAGINLRDDSHGAQTYMKGVLKYWLTTFKFDGFRFDSADSPGGSDRDFVQPYAQSLYSALNPDNSQMWLEEGNAPVLAYAPYNLDYLWDLSFYAANGGGKYLLQNTAKTGTGVSLVESTFAKDIGGGSAGFPTGFQHMTFLQNWDTPQDYSSQSCGGYSQVLDAAAFNLTVPGVPMIYNGEEVGNDKGIDSLNHVPIGWSSPHAAKFKAFYQSMLALRKANPALSQGSLVWTTNSNNSNNVATYYRLSGSNQCYVEINFSGSPKTGILPVPGGTGAWTDVSPSVSPGAASHLLPSTGKFKLAAYDYVVFKRTAANVPAAPASQAAAATSNGSKNLNGTLTTVTSPAVYNLTTLGTADWAAWGFGNGDTGFDEKSTGGAKIGNATALGGSLKAFESKFFGFTWTDGKPDASTTGETKGYYNQGGPGSAISFTVPATTTPQTLTVYVGGYASGGTFTASLSDKSSPVYTNNKLSGGSSYYGYYTLKFGAAKPGQKLTVKWTQTSPGTNITLYAATLQ